MELSESRKQQIQRHYAKLKEADTGTLHAHSLRVGYIAGCLSQATEFKALSTSAAMLLIDQIVSGPGAE